MAAEPPPVIPTPGAAPRAAPRAKPVPSQSQSARGPSAATPASRRPPRDAAAGTLQAASAALDAERQALESERDRFAAEAAALEAEQRSIEAAQAATQASAGAPPDPEDLAALRRREAAFNARLEVARRTERALARRTDALNSRIVEYNARLLRDRT